MSLVLRKLKKVILISSLCFISAGVYAAGVAKTAADAMRCDPDAGDNENGYGSCPFLGSIYDADPVFKKDLDDALKSAGLTGLTGRQGAMNGPDSGLIPVVVGGEKWLLGSVCERGNCGDHYLKILYIPQNMLLPVFITTTERKTCLAMSGMLKHNYYAAMYPTLHQCSRLRHCQ
ncbi:hypothetical protein [Escherichia coli]|uniref:hypothetical protein n=1 Tax=Escherichia coli TaxID=562 RepID=UPI001F0CE705|nr:hypothetical protein [Escherichia coli]